MAEKTVLVVDDDQGHSSMLATILNNWKYKVEKAANGAEAIKKCKSGKNISCVLMDVKMPELNGTEALKIIRSFKPDLPIVMMTAFSEVADAVEAMRSGANDYLAKPLNFEKLKNILQEFCSKDSAKAGSSGLITGSSPVVLNLLEMIEAVAPSEATVLINGESGTGKELAAKTIHAKSARRSGPFVAINCGAFTENLLASELFGHEKGAFTGADKQRSGLFAEASGGSIFLDEIGEMPLSMQVKLLRVLQEKEILSVGSQKPKPLNCRIIAATNRDLAKEVANGTFREDLYYRLNVVNLVMPPLRDRSSDIPELANIFAAKFARANNKSFQGIASDAMEILKKYNWPGNVRELENVMERAIILMNGDVVSRKYLPERLFAESAITAENQLPLIQPGIKAIPTLEEIEREVILQTLAFYDQNKTDAARALGISRKTLHAKLNRYKETQQNEKNNSANKKI